MRVVIKGSIPRKRTVEWGVMTCGLLVIGGFALAAITGIKAFGFFAILGLIFGWPFAMLHDMHLYAEDEE